MSALNGKLDDLRAMTDAQAISWAFANHKQLAAVIGLSGENELWSALASKGLDGGGRKALRGMMDQALAVKTNVPAVNGAGAVRPDKTTMAELLANEYPDPVWVIEGMLPAGLSMLGGRPKLGKSWLALQLAISVGAGGKFMDRDVVQGGVLFLALEDNEGRLQRRSQTQMATGSETVDFVTEWPLLSTPAGADMLAEEVTGGKYRLIIVDTFTRAIGGADQMSGSQMAPIMDRLQRLAIENDVAILIVDHHRKAAASVQDVVDDIAGSTVKTGALDGVIGLYRSRGQRDASLKASGRDFDELDMVVSFDRDLCTWHFMGDGDEVRADTLQSEILAALEELGGKGTTQQVATYLNQQASNISREMGELVKKLRVKRGEKSGRAVPYELIG